MSLRIGIMGGLFNPVHYGHLRAATEARELLALDRVHFLPCAVPPHREAPGVSAELRARMVEAALQGAQGLVLDARELALPAPSYTVRTLEDMHREMPQASFVLLLGEDAFRGLPRWHQWQRIPELAHVAVLRRPGAENAPYPDALREWAAKAETAPGTLFESQAGGLTHCKVTALDISSTRIRELLQAGRDPRYLLPDAVLDIIARENLYRGKTT